MKRKRKTQMNCWLKWIFKKENPLQIPYSDNGNKPAAVENKYEENKRHGVLDIATPQSKALEATITATATLETTYGENQKLVGSLPKVKITKPKLQNCWKIKQCTNCKGREWGCRKYEKCKTSYKASTRSASQTYPDLSREKIAEHEQDQEPIIHLKKGSNAQIGREKYMVLFLLKK